MARSSFRKMELGEYSGTPIRRLRIQSLLLTENRFPPNLAISDHAHAYPHLTIILDGSFIETYQHESFVCRKGSVLIVPQDQVHRDTVGPDGAHSLSIEVSRSLERLLTSESPLLTSPRVISSNVLKPAINRIRAAFSLNQNSSLLEIHCAAMDFILAVTQESVGRPDHPAWLDEILEHIRTDYSRPIRLTELAETAGLSAEHVSRIFRKRMGITIQNFVLQTRLSAAEQQLANSSNPVGDVALACGFIDQAHFSRAFRKAYGVPPRSYRANII